MPEARTNTAVQSIQGRFVTPPFFLFCFFNTVFFFVLAPSLDAVPEARTNTAVQSIICHIIIHICHIIIHICHIIIRIYRRARIQQCKDTMSHHHTHMSHHHTHMSHHHTHMSHHHTHMSHHHTHMSHHRHVWSAPPGIAVGKFISFIYQL